MEARWIAVIGAAAIAVAAWAALRIVRKREDRHQLKQQVQTWEDEGGNVPEVPTVSPQVPPSTRRR